MKKIKTGIMGGSFNPLHNGHMELANTAMKQLALDNMLFIPSGKPYMKEDRIMLNAGQRLEMVRNAIRNIPHYYVSDIEVLRSGNSYTCETLEELTAEYPDRAFYFILGADCLYEIEKWKDPERIFKLCTVVSAVRDSVSALELQKKCRDLTEKYQADILLLDFPKTDISSTEIREDIKAGKDISDKVPYEILRYIEKNHLYQ